MHIYKHWCVCLHYVRSISSARKENRYLGHSNLMSVKKTHILLSHGIHSPRVSACQPSSVRALFHCISFFHRLFSSEILICRLLELVFSALDRSSGLGRVLKVFRHFGKICRFRLQGERIRRLPRVPCLVPAAVGVWEGDQIEMRRRSWCASGCRVRSRIYRTYGRSEADALPLPPRIHGMGPSAIFVRFLPAKNFSTAVVLMYPQPQQLKLRRICRCCQIYATESPFYKLTRHESIINRT